MRRGRGHRSAGRRRFGSDVRGVTPAVSKALEAAVVVLFVAAMTTTLYGGVIPAFRTATGAEVAERTVAAAALQVETAVPPPASEVRVVRRVDLPTSIRGAGYSIHARDGALVLDHPDDRVDVTARLALPDRVVWLAGRWDSGDDAVVLVQGDRDGLEIRLTDRDAIEAGPAAGGHERGGTPRGGLPG